MPKIILIAGSIAAGKSTVATLLTGQLRCRGLTVAQTALDDIADMARPTLPDWDWAHHIHAQMVGLWARTDMDIVVDEGTSTVQEVRQVLDALPPSTEVFLVVLSTTFQDALARVQRDPTRGLSKDPDFLRSQYDNFAQEARALPHHLHLTTKDCDAEGVASEILQHWGGSLGCQ